MVIDSHQHFWKFDPVRDGWITADMKIIRRDFLPQDLKPILEKNQIQGCIAVQAAQSEEETGFLLGLAKENPFIKGVVGWVDLRGKNLREKLKYFSRFPLIKGFRHIIQSEPEGFMSDPAFIRGVSMLAEFGFTYDLLIYHYQLGESLEFLAEVQDVRIAIDHIAKPAIRSKESTSWKASLAAAGSFRNVFCKVSGMVTEADWSNWKEEDFIPYLDDVLEIFGPQRIMYGSDWPVCLLAGTYEDQLGVIRSYLSRFTAEEKGSIMGKNAERFYNL